MITCMFEGGKPALLRHVVVHAIVEKDGALLLIKRTGDMTETGKWALPGGYLERGETAGQAVLRELFEETGWTGEIVSLFRINSRPDRPKEDRQNVAFDFIVKPNAQKSTGDSESSKVEWIPFDRLLPFDEFAFDHGESIKRYIAYAKDPFPLPILD